MNGIEFLKIIKADDELKKIPVVVLTTSEDTEDKFETFGLSVAGYIVKPADYKKFVEAIRTVNLYWTLSELPYGE
jgi:DNA-binding NarL/FixJ family response regulator